MQSNLQTISTRARRSATIAALLVLSAAPIIAQKFSPGIRLNDDPAGVRQTSPFIAVDRSGAIYVAWTELIDPGSNVIVLGRSTDGGATFTNSRVGNEVPALAGMQRGVQLAVDGKGTVHIIWQPAVGDLDVFYTRSTDGGNTFMQPKQISGDSGRHNQDFPSIGVDSSDNIYIAFVDDREKRNGISTHTQIYLTRSTDGGATFSPARRVSNMPKSRGGSCECCNTDIALSPEGNIYISFRSNIDDRRDIWIARSLDRGETFTTIRAASENWTINACPMTGSSIVLDRDGTAHVAWRDSRPSSAGRDYIYYTTLRAEDSICAQDRRISATPKKSNYPSLVVTPDGSVLCAFQDDRNDPSDVLIVGSEDGETFSLPKAPEEDKGTSRQEAPQLIVASNGDRYLVWQDNSRDEGDIIFSSDTSLLELDPTSVVDVGSPLDLALDSSAPNPAGHVVTIRYSVADGVRPGEARLMIYDMLGRAALPPFPVDAGPGRHELRIDCSALPPGHYRCILAAGGRRISRSMIVAR